MDSLIKKKHQIALDHIALLVKDLSTAIEICSEKGWPIGKRERFEGEGTEEVYVGSANNSRLLLMEAIGPGPYQNALKKRGESVHHLGLVCDDLPSTIAELKTKGWVEHRHSAILWEQTQTRWMQYSGMPLLEISESKIFPTLDFCVRVSAPKSFVDVLPGLENGTSNTAVFDSIFRQD